MDTITRSIVAGAILCMSAAHAQAQQRVQIVDPKGTVLTKPPAAGGASLPNAALLDGNQIEAIALASDAPKEATRQDRDELTRIAALLRGGKEDEANSAWNRVAQRHAEKGKDHDKWIPIESYSNYVLNRAYLAPDPDLNARAAKVRAAHVPYEATPVAQQAAAPARAQDEAQLAKVDLQNALQKQQQLLQTMSNISKKMSDTASSIVQNMK